MYSSLLNCELLKIHKEQLSKLALNRVPIVTGCSTKINELTDIIVGVEFKNEHNTANKFQLKFYDNDMGCYVPIFTQKILYNQPIKFHTLQFAARAAYNTKIEIHVCNIAERMSIEIKAELLTYTLPQHLRATLLKVPQHYLLPNGSGIRINNGYTNFIISSHFSNNSLFRVNNYLIRLYYAKKIKQFLLAHCYPVKVTQSALKIALCQKIITFIDSAEEVEEESEEVLQDEILSMISLETVNDPVLNCYKYESDETVESGGRESIILLVNLTETKYLFQSRTQQFSLKQGDLLSVPKTTPYKIISPQDTNKYLLEISF